MLIHHSFDDRFVSLVERLRKQYGAEMLALSGIGEEDLDINNYSKKFFKTDKSAIADCSVDANANVSDNSIFSWETESKKPIMKLNAMYKLWLSAMKKHGIKRANKIIEAEIRGSIRIHDFHFWEKPYCWASSLNMLVQNGMPFYHKKHIGPVKHFDSFINLTLNYVCYLSNQIAGAVALPDFVVYAEYFIRKDFGADWKNQPAAVRIVKQQFQSFICSLNFSWRSNQSPFTNISIFDKYWLENLFKEHVNPDFSKPDMESVKAVQKLFVDVYCEEQLNGLFTFPVLTACLLLNKDNEPMDGEFLDYVSDVTAEHGLFNIYMSNTSDSLSSCCRLRNDIKEANKEYTNSFGAGGLNIGSHRVVAINLPQIAYETESWDDYKRLLEYRVQLTQDILDIHRETIEKNIANGKLPLYRYGYMDLNKQFSTIGFIGMNEAIEMLGFDIVHEDGTTKAKEIVEIMNRANAKRSAIDGKIRNVEQIPGEAAASALATKDKILYENANYDLYSNQYIPLTKETSLSNRIKVQGYFDKSVGGGSILHINVQEKIDKKQAKKLIEHTAKSNVVYFAVNYRLLQCPACQKIYIGEMENSPCHDKPMKKYMRVVGFMTEISSWSSSRREEYAHRKFYKNNDGLSIK
ncbi:MAG TPA: anaerobic ribonucleoside-triphosphate reductase [Saccharofermentans sp.]|nr:anaerobic ribonucleoside-triphosphate reductase [Saccharofermentans sp.]